MQSEQLRPRNTLLGVRASTIGQSIDGDSPEAQIEQGIQFAPTHNLRIIQTLTYLESATKEKQPMQNLIDYALDPKNGIEVILIKSIDRLTRGGSYFYDQLKRQLDPHGIELMDMYGVISNSKVNTLEHLGIQYNWSVYSPSRKTELLEAERAKDEFRDIMSRMIGAEVRYTRLGYYMRRAPYGLSSKRIETPNGKRYILVAFDDESFYILKMYELRCQGNMSDSEIVDEINRLGYKSRTMIRRTKTTSGKVPKTMGGNKLTLKRFWKYIENPIYAGVICEKWTDNEPIKAKFDGLVSYEVFNKANRGKVAIYEHEGKVQLVKRAVPEHQLRKGHFNADYPYRKIVMCSGCRNALYGSASRGRSGKKYPAYHCDKGDHYFRVPKAEFESTIEKFVHQITMSPEHIDNLLGAIETVWDQRKAALGIETKTIDERIDERRLQLGALVDKLKLLSSETAIKFVEGDLMKLEQEIATLEEEKMIKKAKEPLNFETVLKYVRYFLEHLDYLLLQQIDPIKKANFFGILFDQTPTYAEIESGTADPAQLTGLNELFRIKKTNKSLMVRERGLEPPQPFGHYHLKVACIPISPLAQDN